jgi:Cys-Gly metallodipeptidase DUG1
VVLATYGTDPAKRTLLVYGHYDVQPARLEDGWNTDPFTLTEDDTGRMFGRGSTDDKGPILGWLCAIKAHQDLGIDFPVNLKMCFEGMEESGSEGLDDIIYREANEYFAGVDAVCISDNYWLGKTKPCLTYGLRGVSYFSLSIKGPGQDLHSGVFGGTVHEPMTDLVNIMSRLVQPDGKILIPGIMDDVAPLTEDEEGKYNGLEFKLSEFQAAVGSTNNIFDDEKRTLMGRWRYPSLSLHGVEGAFYSPGAKTVIPARVIGKFSIRTVPNQEPDKITQLVKDYVTAEFARLNSKNTMSIECGHAGKWWVSSPNHWNFVAGARAVDKVFGVQPDYTREGGSIPVTLTFQEALQKNVLLLPMGACDDGAHSINEKLDRRNYIEGIKLLGAYLHEFATVEMTN